MLEHRNYIFQLSDSVSSIFGIALIDIKTSISSVEGGDFNV